ncbi:type II toxin-antitoxin system HipA family toxin [Methylobacterium sp. W2]|uniref:type II toxin-antitoxin system HipA family toxin n=1 Tax=Methylobacterium sp. W2 TaxID=2598107 RepID=UPI001D0C195D|nr:type II toxin-antitoxin system HipA family toxin [Methylobacterium sp. W2]
MFRAREGGYIPAGELTFEGGGHQRLGRFVYAASYLARSEKTPLDPIGLPLRRGSVAAAPEEVPLVFHDVGPDGWGKDVLVRAFPSLSLSMPEFLALGGLGRTGDLAFGPTPEGPATWAPGPEPLLDLPRENDDLEALMAAAAAVEAGDADGHHFKLLFRGSADVGGARPKARIRDAGRDWIAKFPAATDRFDDPRVESACLDVAEAAGLPVPERKIVEAGGRAALFVRRFDRSEEMRPYAYLSAATLLKQPSMRYGTDHTYLDIAAAAQAIGVRGAAEAMFERLILNATLHNTDDHLRNHGFLDRGGGWEIAPVFDLVPHPGQRRHVCAPARGIGPEWNPDRAFDAHVPLKIPLRTAEAIRDRIIQAARRLPAFMDERGVTVRDRRTLADAFPSSIGFNPA